MPDLGEFLGGLSASVASSRVLGDLKTVEVAERYAEHDLLKHFPAAHMRFKEVKLTVPVAVQAVVQPSVGVVEDPLDNQQFRSATYRALVNHVGLASLPRALSTRLISQVGRRVTELDSQLRQEMDAREAVAAFTKRVITDFQRIAREGLDQPALQALEQMPQDAEAISDALLGEIPTVPVPTASPAVDVIVESHRLSELPLEAITHLEMTLVEEGRQWIGDGGEGDDRLLLPE